MDQSKPVATPFESESRLIKEESENELFDQKSYQSAVGSLFYLTKRTRPDDACSQYQAKFVTNQQNSTGQL